MQLLIEMPVLAYVKKYLTKKYDHLYKLSQNDSTGQMLSGLLKNQKAKAQMDGFVNRYSEKFVIEVSSTQVFSASQAYYRKEKKITSLTIVRFNNFIEARIKEEMYVLVDLSLQFKLQTRAAAIRAFMEKYDFEESEVQFETLLKAYQRYQVAKTKSKKNHNIEKAFCPAPKSTFSAFSTHNLQAR